MEQKKVIGFSPFENYTNLFVSISKNAIESAGYVVRDGSLKKQKSDFLKLDCVILNWFDELPRNKSKRIAYFLFKTFYIILCKCFKIKIIAVFHNRKPHNINVSFLQKVMTALTFGAASKIILLSKESLYYLDELSVRGLKSKGYYIPHPNYIGAYPDYKGVEARKEAKLRLLFFGAVSRYKNIELIIEAAENMKDENVEFIIVGRPSDEQYKNILISKTKHLNNVKMVLEFIEDKDVGKHFENCDALILPYDKSSLNSGTAILAFSYKKTLVCPDIATIHDFNRDNMYIYNYENDEDHFKQMMQAVVDIYQDYKMDKNTINRKGLELYEEVKEKNNVKVIERAYQELLGDVLR